MCCPRHSGWLPHERVAACLALSCNRTSRTLANPASLPMPLGTLLHTSRRWWGERAHTAARGHQHQLLGGLAMARHASVVRSDVQAPDARLAILPGLPWAACIDPSTCERGNGCVEGSRHIQLRCGSGCTHSGFHFIIPVSSVFASPPNTLTALPWRRRCCCASTSTSASCSMRTRLPATHSRCREYTLAFCTPPPVGTLTSAPSVTRWPMRG